MNYKKWEIDVLENLKKYQNLIQENELAKDLYNGFYIWDSKLIYNPQFMFIGINPGDGNPNNDKTINYKPAEQMSFLEYLDGENPTYTLARETIETFKKIGFTVPEITDILNNKSVKTNLHYVITKQENDIKKCFNFLAKKGFQEFWVKSYKWTGDLINILNPKIIICEGKGVFDTIKDLEDFNDLEWKDNCGSFTRIDGIKVIGYSRTFSNIRNKERLAFLISNAMQITSL